MLPRPGPPPPLPRSHPHLPPQPPLLSALHTRRRCVGAQVSREPPPPLPDGYVPGEQVYYTGSNETLASGDRLEHGKRGEVVGPATIESHTGKGVTVLFPAKGAGSTATSTRPAATATPPRSHPQLPAAPAAPSPPFGEVFAILVVAIVVAARVTKRLDALDRCIKHLLHLVRVWRK